MSKYTKPIPLDKLPETPAVYGEMIEEYNQTKKTVSRDIEVEGLGKGRLVLSKQNKGKPFFYADEANIEANQKAAKQLQTAETIANLPLILAPFFTIAKGGQRIIKQKRSNEIKKAALAAEDLDKVKNVIDLVSSRAKGNVKPEIPSRTTAPTTSIMNMYKDTGITPQQRQAISNIVLQQKTTDDIESYGFGPEGPRGGATDEQIMQAYREITGELQLDPNRVESRENRTRTSSLTGPNPNLLNMAQSPSGSGPTGKITWRNIPKLDRFLSGQTTSLDRTTAGLIQNPNFKLGDFLQGIDQELERVRRQYPNIDVDTNLQRFKWQWHHINPDKMPVDFYVGLNNVADRDLITDTLLRETNVSAGMNPSNRIGLPTEVHDEITDWLDTEIGKRSEVITQKISDDLGYGLTLTGRGSRAAKLQFNQRFANEPVQTRIPYIIEYGQKIAESSRILDELMNQFDIFYDIPNGFRLDIDVNTMERMLARLDEGKPTIRTLREIIEEVTDGMRIPVTNDLGVQGIAEPRDPNLIRAIDIEGMLRDHKAGQSVLDNKEIRALGKELNQIYQMDLDIKGASTSAYIKAWYNERFGGDRKTGPKTGPN
tara:strand:- start:45 stop:1841 length:1797 start_codon:yes stop_codon:yes gene_type:complete